MLGLSLPNTETCLVCLLSNPETWFCFCQPTDLGPRQRHAWSQTQTKRNTWSLFYQTQKHAWPLGHRWSLHLTSVDFGEQWPNTKTHPNVTNPAPTDAAWPDDSTAWFVGAPLGPKTHQTGPGFSAATKATHPNRRCARGRTTLLHGPRESH